MPLLLRVLLVSSASMLTAALLTTLVLVSLKPRPDGRACVPLDATAMESIASGRSDGVSIDPIAGVAVESKYRENVRLVAMRFNDGAGVRSGVWMLLELKPAEYLTLSIDAAARQYTAFPNTLFGQELTQDEDGVREAHACLDARTHALSARPEPR